MADNTRSESIQRTLECLPIIASGDPIQGVSLVNIANTIGCSKPLVLRALHNLEIAGFVEQLTNKNWRLGSRLARIAVQALTELDKQQRKLDELRRNFSRTN